MSITQITTHEQDALDRVIEQYKNSLNLLAIISVFAKQVQETENAFISLVNRVDIDTSEGVQLDK